MPGTTETQTEGTAKLIGEAVVSEPELFPAVITQSSTLFLAVPHMPTPTFPVRTENRVGTSLPFRSVLVVLRLEIKQPLSPTAVRKHSTRLIFSFGRNPLPETWTIEPETNPREGVITRCGAVLATAGSTESTERYENESANIKRNRTHEVIRHSIDTSQSA